MGNLLTVRAYREVGGQMLMAYRQRWMMTHTLGPDAEKVKLRRVEYYDFAAKRACEIQMDVAGTTPKTITCPEANGTSTVKRLGEDGITVDTIDTLSKSNKVVATAKGNGAKVDIPAEWLQNIRPTPLPNFKDEDAPPPVYDFH